MAKILALRLVRLIATMLAVSFLTFIMVAFLPGDPVNAVLPITEERTPEIEAAVRAELNLDKPVITRYVMWLGDVLQGDLGKSFVTDQPVAETIKDRLPVTAQLAVMSIGLALLLAIPIGVLGAYKQGKAPDQISSAGVQVALAVPNFVLAVFLIRFFSIDIPIFPAGSWNRISDGIGPNLRNAFLPTCALALSQMAVFSRLLRSDMVNTLREDFVTSARAKGLSDRYILFRHALRPSSLSLVTIAGINIGALLGGTVIVEQIFSLPGLGRRLIAAIGVGDIMVIQGITVFIAFAYVVINTAVDLFYMVVDPRIRRG